MIMLRVVSAHNLTGKQHFVRSIDLNRFSNSAVRIALSSLAGSARALTGRLSRGPPPIPWPSRPLLLCRVLPLAWHCCKHCGSSTGATRALAGRHEGSRIASDGQIGSTLDMPTSGSAKPPAGGPAKASPGTSDKAATSASASSAAATPNYGRLLRQWFLGLTDHERACMLVLEDATTVHASVWSSRAGPISVCRRLFHVCEVSPCSVVVSLLSFSSQSAEYVHSQVREGRRRLLLRRDAREHGSHLGLERAVEQSTSPRQQPHVHRRGGERVQILRGDECDGLRWRHTRMADRRHLSQTTLLSTNTQQ